MIKTIAVGSDDAGFRLKEEVKRYLESEGHTVTDYGCESSDPVDYPDVALLVAKAVARGDHDRAILVCGTGIGMAITANKVPGVYASVAHDAYSAAKARTSNNTQVLALGARVVAPELSGYPVTLPGPAGKQDPQWHAGSVPVGEQCFVKFAWSRPAALQLAHDGIH